MQNNISSHHVGVIDIGSNSIRLVIYDALKRVPIPLFNEKKLCGLGRYLHETGKLNPEGVKEAYKILARFTTLGKANGVERLFIFATSAVRDAEDGHLFIEKVRKHYGVDILVLSDEEEARFAAYGILASIWNADGVVGDLGGGSLEFADIASYNVSAMESYPLGALRLMEQCADADACYEIIDAALTQSMAIASLKGRNFYAIGGAFRNVAKIHMLRIHYPLNVIHHYSVSAEEFLSTLQELANMSVTDIEEIAHVSGKRIETLPFAARILERIVTLGKPERLIFSSHGVREGVLYGELPAIVQKQDPLLVGCRDIMTRLSFPPQYGDDIAQWVAPLFPHRNGAMERIHLAACILSEFASLEHKGYREEFAFRKVINASLDAINHQERIYIATALYHRYRYDMDVSWIETMQEVLEDDMLHEAMTLGYAMRLARNIGAGMPGSLHGITLNITPLTVQLIFKENGYLYASAVEKRLNQLADHLELEAEVIVR